MRTADGPDRAFRRLNPPGASLINVEGRSGSGPACFLALLVL